jgi:hypothetical protein
VPCFDLAKILKRKPADVALELSRMLAGEAASIEYKTEAIGGYVNLQISDTFLAQAMQQAITWLGAPRSLTPRHAKDYFLAVGAIIGQESDFKPADDICRSVDCVYDLLGNDHSMWYLMGDTPTIMGNRLRPALPAHGRAVSRTQQDETLKNMNVDRSQAIFESDLAPMVHDFLNSSVAQDMGLIRDELSQAIYYGKGEMAVALRSAGGTLYPFAYTLYVIESLRSSTGDARRITVFVPSKIGLILKDFLAGRGNELDDLQITCVDPKSLQADVLEIRSAVESLDAHFLKLAQTLQLLSPRPIHAVRNRQAILGVIDMPLALSEMAAKLQLPGIFDAINQSIETEAMLRRLA